MRTHESLCFTVKNLVLFTHFSVDTFLYFLFRSTYFFLTPSVSAYLSLFLSLPFSLPTIENARDLYRQSDRDRS